jgi:hypothetical protein
VLGRLKNFVKPYDFVLAPIVNDVDLDAQAEKPILIRRFTKNSEEWLGATYYNVRTGKKVCIAFGRSTGPNVVPVKSYRQILDVYLNNPEAKFLGPGGNRCNPFTGCFGMGNSDAKNVSEDKIVSERTNLNYVDERNRDVQPVTSVNLIRSAGSTLVECLGGLVQLHRHRRGDVFVGDHLDIRASAA